MRYRKVGRSGLDVSVIGLGSWLTFGAALDADQTRDCVRRAFDLGITFFDTANEYAQGGAEETLAPALGELPRNGIVIASKVYWPMGERPTEWGLSRKHIVEQCEASLRRLNVDYIDLYQCHRYDTQRPMEETCGTMDHLARQGKILYWGVSEWTAEQIAAAVLLCGERGWERPISNQSQYSLLWRTIERQALPVSDALGLGTLAFSPLAMGILTGKYVNSEHVPSDSRGAGPSFAFFSEDDNWRDMPYFNQPTLDAIQEVKPLAEEAGCTLSQLALAWCLRQPGVAGVITGATKVQQLEDNAKAGDLDLGDLPDRVAELLRPHADFVAPTAPNMDS